MALAFRQLSAGAWVVSRSVLGHSSLDSGYAMALRDWLAEQG
jgi:hypothetical protein